MRIIIPFLLLLFISCRSNPKSARFLTTVHTTEFMGLDEGKPGEDIKVWGKHYLSNEIAIDFVITANDDTIIKKTITIGDFKNRIPDNIIHDGIMGVPTFCGYDEKNDSFLFFIEFFIPDTNIAKSLMIGIKRNGKFS